MPALLNFHQTQLDPITEPVLDIIKAVRYGHGQIPRTSPTAIFMYGLASGLIIMTSIIGLLLVLFDRILRKENVKTIRFGPHFPESQGGDKFFLEQKNGTIYEGIVTFNESHYYEIRSDEAIDQESVIIPSSKLEQAEIEDDRKKAKREMRKVEEEHEYQAFMGRFSIENFATFMDANVDNDEIEEVYGYYK
ncbi:uncharacterized protein Bfra_003193 [Botrytis fragariae]|uniref:Uncharacterized protein n=1 Tax=Botrytis fragariae TaxID=1964551 RepID=A0A8H6B011_9HELO|nr:uncharacterized protein Bfra_003193 [Botrytis fragariae]KAF5876786.1 hypothetical protein Bfra_003193 [Botrytis fragariae]